MPQGGSEPPSWAARLDGLLARLGDPPRPHLSLVSDEEDEPAKRREPCRVSFTVEQGREALARALEKSVSGSVPAGAVAWLLVDRPSHSERVRVGQILRKLADAGEVVRIPPNGHGACRWEAA